MGIAEDDENDKDEEDDEENEDEEDDEDDRDTSDADCDSSPPPVDSGLFVVSGESAVDKVDMRSLVDDGITASVNDSNAVVVVPVINGDRIVSDEDKDEE